MKSTADHEDDWMSIAFDLLQRHIQTLVDDNTQWRTLIVELKVYALADPEHAVGEVKGEGLIKSTGLMYRQDYVLFLRAAANKMFFREYFDPERAATALDTPIPGFES